MSRLCALVVKHRETGNALPAPETLRREMVVTLAAVEAH